VRKLCYPCQTCWPQAHGTVSVGTFLVNCRLQTGQGLVITYVTTLSSLRIEPPVEDLCTSRARMVSLADRIAHDSLLPPLGYRTFAQARPRATSSAPKCPTRSSSCGIETGHGKDVLSRCCEHHSWKPVRRRASHSCPDTVVAVAQIFSVTSRKFRWLAASAV